MLVIGLTILFAVAGFISLSLALFGLNRNTMPGANYFSYTMFLMAVWPLIQAVDIFATDINLKILLMKLRLDAPAFAAIFYLLMTAELTAQARFFTKRRISLLFIIPILGAILNWTSPNLLFRYDFFIESNNLIPILHWTNGPLFWVWLVYVAVLYLSQFYLLIRSRQIASPLSFKQTVTIFASTAFLLYIDVAFHLGFTPINGLNLTPAALAVTGLLAAWAIFQYQIFEILPLARATVIEQLSDGIIVLSKTNFVIDINPAAAELIGRSVDQTIGQAAQVVFDPWLDLMEKFKHTFETREQILIGIGESAQEFEISFSPLLDNKKNTAGRIIVLHNLNSREGQKFKLHSREKHTVKHTHEWPNAETTEKFNSAIKGKQQTYWLVDWLKNYFSPPLRTDLVSPNDVQPEWYAIVERTFTQILRVAAILSPIDTFLSYPDLFKSTEKFLILFTIEFSLSTLAIIRSIPFKGRAIGFLLILYLYSVIEIATAGYSPESLMFFTMITVTAGLLLRGRSGWTTLFISTVILAFFGWQIKIGALLPSGMGASQFYLDLPAFFPIQILLSFVISAGGINIVLTAMWRNWNLSWQKEKQSLTLLQAERDLLEERAQERANELFKSEAKFQSLVETLPIVVYQDLPNDKGTTIYVGPQIETMLGYAQIEWINNPEFWKEITYPDDWKLVEETIREVLNQGHSVSEYRVIAKDNSIVWVRDETILIKDESGQPQLIHGTLMNISDRKLTGERLKEAEELFNHVVKNIDEVFWLTNPATGEEIFISPSAEKIWGRSVKELMELPDVFINSIVEEDRPIVVEALERQALGEGTEIEYRILRPDGSIRWIWDHSVVILDETGKVNRIAGFALDISNTKMANAALEHAAKQYRELFENSPISLWEEDFSEVKLYLNSLRTQGVTDFKLYLEAHPEIVAECAKLVKVIDVNQASLRLYRANNKAELLGNLSLVFDTQNLPNFIVELTHIADSDYEFNWTGENLTLANERLTVNVQWSVVAGYEDTLSRVIVSVVDITKEKDAEKLLLRQSEQYAALSQIAIDLLDNRTLDEILEITVEKAALLLDAPFGELMLKEDDKLVVRASTENQHFLLGDAVGRSESKLSWQAHDTGEPAVIEDYSKWEEHRSIYNTTHLYAVADFPIMIGEICIGVLGMGRNQPNFPFDTHQVQLGQWLAQLVALVLKNSELLETTKLQVAALNSTANAIVITDQLGNIQWANPSFTALTGYSVEEVVGKNPRILKSGLTSDELYKDLWATLLTGHAWQGEVINRHKNGNNYFEEMTITPLRDEHGDIYRFIAVKQDITSRKQAEQAIKESEIKFRTLFETLPVGISVMDENQNVIEVNPALKRIYRSSQDSIEKNKFKNYQYLRENGTSLPLEELTTAENLLKQGIIPELEVGIILDDQTVTWVRVKSTLLPLKGMGYVVVTTDITESKLSQENLRLSEEKYRLIYENLDDVIYQTDYHGNLTAVSPSVFKQSGYLPEELVGQNVIHFYPFPEEYLTLVSLIEEKGSVNDFELRLKRKDGNLIFVSVTTRTILNVNGDPVGTEGVMRDISERKQVEARILQLNAELESRVLERTEEIQASNRYLSALLEASIALNKNLNLNEILDLIIIQAKKIVSFDSLNLMLIEEDQAYIARRIRNDGSKTMERNLLESRYPLSWPNFRQLLETGKSVYIPDTHNTPDWQNDENTDWIRTYAGIPLLITDKIIGFLNFNHREPNSFTPKDILLLEALANHASVAIQNARLLEELKIALEKEQGMRDQLVHADKLAALGKMVAVIAHEINNPIQTVKNTFYLIEDQIIPGSPAVEYLKMASAEANRISDLVGQLRETYRARSKTFVRVNVMTLLDEVHNLLAPQMKKNQVEWIQLNTINPGFVFAIRNNLKQVFINLCMNAIEAMSEMHGGKLTLSLNFKLDSNWVGVVFHNTGPLIPQEALNHIFEPFFTTKGLGSGLGLSICYDIIKQHSGEITVESYPHTGVSFTVWLPLAPDQGGQV